MQKTPRIALFCSGSGSNAENIIRYFAGKDLFEFPLIVSNKADAFVHTRAASLNISSVTFSYTSFRDGYDIVNLLREYNIDYIVLAGFLLKISAPILEAFPGKIINIHPALLPKFGGKGMYGHHVHEAVVAAGEKESGITIHFVNEHYDEGNVIFQAKCTVDATDDADSVAQKVHALEYAHFPATIEMLWGGK
jgi:phosphoribosylglycinamide formyltransferase-1